MSFKLANDSYPVFSGYIKALYLLIGLTMLFDSIGRVLTVYRGTIAMLVMTFITSTCGLIMSCLAKARGTKNKSKITAVFSCVVAAMIFQTAQIVLVNKSVSYNERENPVLAIAVIVCQALRVILIFTTGIIIVTMTTGRDNPQCPRLSMPAKLLVGIPTIMSSLCIAAYLIIFAIASSVSGHVVSVNHYTQIACTVLVGLGTILGVVLGFIHRQPRRPQPQDNDAFQSVVVA